MTNVASNLGGGSLRRLLGAFLATSLLACLLAPGALGYGLKSFTAEFKADEAGAPTVQAGSHPYTAAATIKFETEQVNGSTGTKGDAKDIDIELPAGLIGDPSATPTCEPGLVDLEACPANTQIGMAHVQVFGGQNVPMYNVTPPPGVPAEFGFKVLGYVPVLVNASVRPGEPGGSEGFGLDLHIHNVSQASPVEAAGLEFFGIPPAVGAQKAFLTLPTSCGRPLEIRAHVTSWEGGSASSSTVVTDSLGNPVTITGCNLEPFEPQITTSLDSGSTDSPSGLTVEVETPQQTNPAGLASAHLKSATVALPEGFTINPSAASGLVGCSVAQFDRLGEGPSACPENSKVGSVEIDTPIIRNPLRGGVYLARQGENPFGSLVALYLVAEGEGVYIKLPGQVSEDPLTGRVSVSFDETPQLPFETLTLHLFDGPRAALATPVVCGTQPVSASLAPWSGQPAVALQSPLVVSTGAAGSACPASPGARPFGLGFEASTVSPAAALHSPFNLKVTRPDGAQELGRIDATLPEGLLATLKGVPECSAADAAAARCGAASQIGSLVVGTGAGPDPYYVKNGRAYLTGPYGGAPLGLDFVVPALAGPLDLGTVNVRAALSIDPVTTKVTVRSDALPKILQGIPLRLRSVALGIDRSGFVVNPTSCDPTAVTAQVTSTEGATANLSDRFQAAGCGSLPFAPKLKLALKGGTKRNGNPALTAILTQPSGQANIRRVSVALPRSEFLEQGHIKTVCTRVQFAAEACPANSIYGSAEVSTPLLGEPLRGPVYLRSSSHALPDLVAALKGPASQPIELDLGGRIDSVRGALRTTFESVPDAAVSRFVLRLRGGKKSLLVNSTNVCRGRDKATVRAVGQNGTAHDFAAPLRASCGKGAGGKAKGKRKAGR